jgi:hypothetical protein
MNYKKKKKIWYLTEVTVAFIIEITLQNERTKTIAKSTSLYIIKLFWWTSQIMKNISWTLTKWSGTKNKHALCKKIHKYYSSLFQSWHWPYTLTCRNGKYLVNQMTRTDHSSGQWKIEITELHNLWLGVQQEVQYYIQAIYIHCR